MSTTLERKKSFYPTPQNQLHIPALAKEYGMSDNALINFAINELYKKKQKRLHVKR